MACLCRKSCTHTVSKEGTSEQMDERMHARLEQQARIQVSSLYRHPTTTTNNIVRAPLSDSDGLVLSSPPPASASLEQQKLMCILIKSAASSSTSSASTQYCAIEPMNLLLCVLSWLRQTHHRREITNGRRGRCRRPF